MNRIGYNCRGRVLCHDAAILLEGEDPLTTLYEAVIGTISTDIHLLFEDGKEVHLAMLEDPDQWEEDWKELGIELDDVPAYIAGLVTERTDY